MTRVKVYYIARIVLTALVGVLAAGLVLLSSVYAVETFDILLIAIGVVAVASNLPTFVLSLRAVISKQRWEWINLVLSVVGMGLGASFAFLQRDARILILLLLLYGAVLPIIRVSLVTERVKQARREMPKLVVSVLMLIASFCEAEDIILKVLGFTCMGVSALYLILRLITIRSYFEMCNELQAAAEEQKEDM